MIIAEPNEIVIAIFRDMFPAYAGPITTTLTAADVEGWDSLRHTELIINLEDALGVVIDPAVAFEASSLGALLGSIPGYGG